MKDFLIGLWWFAVALLSLVGAYIAAGLILALIAALFAR